MFKLPLDLSRRAGLRIDNANLGPEYCTWTANLVALRRDANVGVRVLDKNVEGVGYADRGTTGDCRQLLILDGVVMAVNADVPPRTVDRVQLC